MVMAACTGDAADRDAGVDVMPEPPDAAPDLFGEDCPLPNVPGYPQAIATCHGERGFCWDEDGDGDLVGTCRPWCEEDGSWQHNKVCVGTRAGAVPTWTSDGMSNKPFVCVCVPPK